MPFSPDGKWYWDGEKWIPSPPTSHSTTNSQNQFNTGFVSSLPDDVVYNYPIQNMIIEDQKYDRKVVFIVSGIVLIVLFACIGWVLSVSTVEPDQVTLTYIYVHNGNEVVATYSDQYGNIQQEFDFYEGDVIVQYSGEMYEGDYMIGTISVTNFDEDPCAATVVYMVSINGGDFIELAKTGPAVIDQYDDIIASFTYIHGNIET